MSKLTTFNPVFQLPHSALTQENCLMTIFEAAFSFCQLFPHLSLNFQSLPTLCPTLIQTQLFAQTSKPFLSEADILQQICHSRLRRFIGSFVIFFIVVVIVATCPPGGGMGGEHGGDEDEDDEPLYELETLPEPKLKQNIFRNKHLLNRWITITFNAKKRFIGDAK